MRLPLVFILITTAIDSMGIGLILPVMPALLREIGDFSLSEAALWGGLLATSFAIMQFLFGPVVGALSDRYGRRPIMLTALFVMALDYLVMAVAQTFWLLLAGRIVGGITAATQPTAAAFMADISKPEEKSARFALIGAAFGVGFVLGPLLGGLLADFGTRAPFYAAAALAAINMIFGYFVMPETVTDEIRRPLTVKRTNPLGAFQNVGLNPQLRRFLILFFFYEIAFFAYPAVWAYFTEARFDWSPRMIGISLAAFGISIAVVQGGMMKIFLSKFGDRGTVIFGLVLNMVAFLFMAVVENGTLALLATPLTALGVVAGPAIQGMMSRMTAADSQGELQGVFYSTAALATIGSPLIMTQIFAYFTREGAGIVLPGAPFLLSLALMALCLWLIATMPPGNESPDEAPT